MEEYDYDEDDDRIGILGVIIFALWIIIGRPLTILFFSAAGRVGMAIAITIGILVYGTMIN